MKIACGSQHKKGLLLLCPFVMCVFFSCGGGKDETPVVPPLSFPLSRTAIGYGVITASYTHVMETPENGGVSRGYLRQGSVVSIRERQIIRREGRLESWVLVEGISSGWLRENVMGIYDSESRAQTASESLFQ